MFPSLPAAGTSTDAIEELLKVMNPSSRDNFDIPAGYTYLGQFIDHDITFDPTSQLQRRNDPNALVDFRTPRLDLDSLYGSGPADQPFLYESEEERDRAIKLLAGDHDLQRNAQGRALIGDPRNDENLIVTQLQLLFIRFHNQVVDYVRSCDGPRLAGADLLREAQRIVRWHYQWIVAHDYLRRIVGPKLAGSGLERRFYRWDRDPFIPVEFSGAAFRFGHSMVRVDYKVNDRKQPPTKKHIVAEEDDPLPLVHLGGFRHLPPELRITWRLFFELPGQSGTQFSRLIDTNIAHPLMHLPAGVDPERRALPALNLMRAGALGLPSGFDVADAMGEPRLTETQLRLGGIAKKREYAELASAPPLWWYVLCEAASEHGDGGKHLGPVGGRIVAEVLFGLLDADPHSYLRRWPAWTPELCGATAGDFTMADLIAFTEGED